MANMTESQLLADLASISGVLSVSTVSNVDKVEDTKFETKLSVEVMWTGLSEITQKPISLTASIQYNVFKRGQVGLESAYYEGDEPKNPVAKDVKIISSSYENIANLYNSKALQDRVLVAVINQCTAVFLESGATPNHTNRMKMVAAANQNMYLVVSQFMGAVCINSTVQAAGNACTDSTLLSIVSGAWDSYANLLVA
jgi:hypothetical protein